MSSSGQYNGIPANIDDYELLTPAVVAKAGLACTGDPLQNYSEGVFFSLNHDSSFNLVYATQSGLDGIRGVTGDCSALSAGNAIDASGPRHPGLIEVLVGDAEKPADTPVACRAVNQIVNCWKSFPGLVTYVGTTAVQASDPASQNAYLTSFLNTFVKADQQVAEKTASIGSAGD